VSGRSIYEQVLSGIGQAYATPPAARVRPSAAIVLWRRNAKKQIEVFWVRRSAILRFMGGWHAFPGGGIGAIDLSIPVQGKPIGVDAAYEHEDVPGADGLELRATLIDGLLSCAVRELFEETGVLLHTGETQPSNEELGDARRKLLDRKSSFDETLAGLGVKLDASQLTYAGRWITPPFSTIRFDARFFLLEWPQDQPVQPEIWAGELDQGTWITPAEALQGWRRAEVLVPQPVLHILRVLHEDGPEKGLHRLLPGEEHGPSPHRVEFRREISAVPQRTATLPPATHTSAYLIGRREVIIVDPGSSNPDELDRLKRAVRSVALQDGGLVKAIWLTHHHPDHVGGALAMKQAVGAPICAHPLTAEHLEARGIEVDQPLHDGQVVVLAGDPPVTIRVIHTPGHARGHLSFYVEETKSVITGDMVAGHSTIIIDPPEGDMTDYMESLQKLAALEPKVLLPSHGTMIANAVERLNALYAHRLRREQQVLEAWRHGLRDPVEILPAVYTDIGVHEYPMAERQIAAHIDRLQRLGMI
jgi:glyoxylase-like metal-dependent hydrolase (beta-lactamase superfamily II)/8-oxo-dGTP pyrophosphatase MutT (NUDIX family)